MRWALMTALMVAVVAVRGAAPAAAQVTAEAVATLSADTIGLGDVFQLFVTVEVSPGSAVYFPDSVATAFALESFRPVTWSAESAGDGASLTLTYPLIAFRVGLAPIPGLDVFIGRAADVGGERLPGGSVVGSWRDIETGTVVSASLPRAAIPRREVWVSSIIVLEDIASGLEPDRPREEALASAPPPDSDLVRWQKALDELDRILALGLHTEGRTDEFYSRSSAVVRTFVEAFDAEWRSSLTSSELMGRLEASTNGSASELYASMRAAEIVKFGLLRPDASTAEGHWGDLRTWVHASRGIES